MQLDNVRLLVDKFNQCFYFYRDVLGLKVTWGEPGSGYASFEAGTQSIAIFNKDEMATAVHTEELPNESAGKDTFSLIFRVDNLEETCMYFAEKGVRLIDRIKDRPDWGIRTAHLRDPDGNLIELVSSLPKEKWSSQLVASNKKYGVQN